MAFEITRQEITKQANDLLKLFRQTRDQKFKDEELRLRRIVAELEAYSAGSSSVSQIIPGTNVTVSPTGGTGNVTINATTQTLNQVTTAGNTTTNPIFVGGITTPYVQLNTAATPTLQPGMFGWNDAFGTADLRLKGNNVTLQLGQEILARVVNKTGADLLESQYRVVRVRVASEGGAQGQRLAVVLAQGNNDPDSATTLGVVTEDIANNQEGFITLTGNVNNINTTGSLQGETWVDGDVLYLSPTTAGALTKVKPSAPNHTVIVGYVLYAHSTQGRIFVKVDNGYELDELHNVLINGVANNDLLQYDSVTQVWKNKTISAIFGGTPLVSVPTLAQVTTAGNTTTNLITVGGLTSTGTIYAGVASTTNGTIRVERSGGNTGLIFRGSDGNIVGAGFVAVHEPYNYSDASHNFNIGHASAGNFNWYAGGNTPLNSNTHLMRLTRGGNLLIGTTTDAGYKLDVAGNTRVNGGNTTSDIPFIVNNRFQFRGDGVLSYGAASAHGRLNWDASGAYFYGLSGYGVGLGANGVLNHLFINTSGNVGIGTTSPTSKLHIAGGRVEIDNGFNLESRTSTGNALVGLIGMSTNSINVGIWEGNYMNDLFLKGGNGSVYADFSQGNSKFFAVRGVASATPTEYMRVTSAGNVGIGTSSPASKLAVLNTANTVAALIGGGAAAPGWVGIGTVNSGALPFIQGYNNAVNVANTISLNPSGGNVLIGTATDAGYKLDVVGTTRIQGTTTITPAANTSAIVSTGYSVTGSGTTPLVDLSGTWNTTGIVNAFRINITNTASSSASNLINLQVGGNTLFRVNASSIAGITTGGPISPNGYGFGVGLAGIFTADGTGAYTSSGTSIKFSDGLSADGYSYIFESGQYSNKTFTSGTGGFIWVKRNFAPTSGTGVLNILHLQNTINQTGGANGITRGLYIQPTLTAAADWRSVEWSNNTGWGLYGAGTGLNYLNGALLIGTTTNAGYKLDVNGTARIQSDLTVASLTTDGPVKSVSGMLVSVAGYTGSFTVPTNPPGMQTLVIQDGIITNVL